MVHSRDRRIFSYSRKQEEQGDKTEDTIEDKERTQRRGNDGTLGATYRVFRRILELKESGRGNKRTRNHIF